MFAALAVAFLLQDAPADLYKKVEEKYAAAKSFSMTVETKFSGKRDGKEVAGTMKGAFRSKGEGQVVAEFSGSMGGQAIPKATYISDGRSLAVLVEGTRSQRRAHTLPLAAWGRRFCLRAGLLGSAGSLFGAVYQSDSVKLDELFKVSGLADGGKEKVGDVECRILTCTVSSPDPEGAPIKCRLWIDPAKLVVLKRESVETRKSESVTFVESFANPLFDAEIADDVFKMP